MKFIELEIKNIASIGYAKISFETSNVNQPIPTGTILQIYAVRL